MSIDNSNKENRVIPGRSDGANLSFDHLLYVQYRLKFSSEVKFLLKRSPICGFDFKCQLCKSLLKASELQEHCSKAKHIKKMKDVAQLFYNRNERVLQFLCDPRFQVTLRDTQLPLESLPSSENNPVAQPSDCVKNSSEQDLSLTSNAENCCCRKRLDTAPLKESSYESENLRIDMQSKNTSLSSLQISAYKKILFTVCNENITRVNFYDFDCNWKIIVVHIHNALVCSLYSVGGLMKSVAAVIFQYDLPSSDEYAVLAVLSRSIVKQPVAHPTSNIKYWRVWQHLLYLIKPMARSRLLSNMSLETAADHSTLTSFRHNHVYLYLDSFPKVDELRNKHLTFHTYKILSAPAESNESSAVEMHKKINEPKRLDQLHILNLYLDSFNTMYQLHSQEMFDIFKNLETQSKVLKCSVTESKSLDHAHIFNLHLDSFNTMYHLHSQELFDIFMNLQAQSKERKCTVTKSKFACLATIEVEQGDFDLSCPKESVNMATLDSQTFSNKHINLYLDHFPTVRNFQYQGNLYESSVNEITDSNKNQSAPQKIQTSPQKILTDPQKILTDPQKVLTDPQKILTDPQVLKGPPKILKDPQNILADSQNILTDPNKILTGPQKISTDSQKLPTEPQKIPMDSQKIPTEPQEIPMYPQSNAQRIPSNSQVIQSVTPEPICQFSDKIDLKILEGKCFNLYLDSFPNLQPCIGQNCVCIFESIMKNNAETSAKYHSEPKMFFMRFMTECSDLEPEDLLRVQYQTVSGDWFFLFSYVENTISCTLCDLLLPSDSKQILHAHIKSRFHQILQKSINQIYHPIYYSTKRRWIPVKSIQDETNSSQVTNSSKEASPNNTHPADINLAEFKSKYIDLPISDLYRIQYRTNSVDWRFMFTKSGPFYLCNLCGNTSMSSWNILNHLKRKAHTKLVQERITGMHHPIYFPQIDQSFPANALTDIVQPIPISSEAASSGSLSSRSKTKSSSETSIDTAEPIRIPSEADSSENISYRTKIKPLIQEIPIKSIHQSQPIDGGIQTDRKYEVPVKVSKQRASGENQAADVYKSLKDEQRKKLKTVKSVCRIREAFRQKQIFSQIWDNSTFKTSFLSKSYEQFKVDYVKLNVEALLEVKYMDSKNHWVAMITLKEDYIYICNLCGAVPLGSIQNLETHIVGMKHKLNLQSINKMYHPIHCKSIETYSATENKENVPQKSSAKIELVALNKSSKNIAPNINEISRSRLEQFKDDYVKLNAEALLEVEYMDSKKLWSHMITLKDDCIYMCNLCGVVQLGGIKHLKIHILGRKHKLNVKRLIKIHHPIYCVSKERYSKTENEQATPQTSSGKHEILTVNKNMGSNNGLNDFSEISKNRLEKTQNNAHISAAKSQILTVNKNKSSNNLSNSVSEIENSLERFKLDYVKLNAEALLDVKYMDSKNDWFAMIMLKEDYIYICNLCGAVPLGSIQNLKTHILGIKHKLNLKSINKMYHPIHYKLNETSSKTENKQQIPQIPLAEIDPVSINKNTTSNNLSSNISGITGKRLEEFKQNYVKMSTEELFKIRYRVGSKSWKYMFESDKSGYVCNLCATDRINRDMNFELHIQGYKHTSRLQLIREIYYPPLCSSDSTVPSETMNVSSSSNSLQLISWAPERKQMGNLIEFKLKYVDLSMSNLLMVQYQTDEGKWAFLLAFDKSRYKCNLCEVYVGNESNLEVHLRGLFHTNKIMKSKLFHPFFCPGMKDITTLPSTFKNVTTLTSMDLPTDDSSRQLAECLRKTIIRAESLFQDGFKWVYKWLDIVVIMNIEFQTDTKPWNYMFAMENDLGLYLCQLCEEQVVYLENDDEVKRHVCSNFHSEHMNKVKSIYHERLCGLATDKKIIPTVMDRLQNIISCTEYLVEVWTRSEIPVEFKSVIDRFQNILFESFIQEYVNLDIKTLKCIQYKTCNNEWKKMIASNQSGYVCNLCQGEYLGNVDFVTCHIQLGRHTRRLNSVEAVRHPSYAPFTKKAVTHSAEIQAIVKNIEENRKVETDYTKFLKLTVEEFKDTYVELHVDDIFETQYKPTSKNFWDFMFVEKSGTLLCNICWQTIILRKDRIAKHVLSPFHVENMQSIHGLYHPIFQPMKNIEKDNLQGEALSKNIQKQHALLQGILKKFSTPNSTHEKSNENSESDTEQNLNISGQISEVVCSKKSNENSESDTETEQYLDVTIQDSEVICQNSNSFEEEISECNQLTDNGRQQLDKQKTRNEKISKKPSVIYSKLTDQELTKVQFFNVHSNDWQYVLTSSQETIYFCKICEKTIGIEESALKHNQGFQHNKYIANKTEELRYPNGSKGKKVEDKRLGIDYFLKTKYREKQCNKFRPMLVYSVKPVYKCRLCDVESVGTKANASHCHGSRHIKKLITLKIRHPAYCILFDQLTSTSKGSDPQSSAKDSNITGFVASTANAVAKTMQLTVDRNMNNESLINNWIEKCAALTAKDLLKIQYRTSQANGWRDMVQKSGQEKIYKCKACGDKEVTIRNHLKPHVTARKHVAQLALKSWTLRHPNYYIALDFRKLIKFRQNEVTKDTSYSHFESDESMHSYSAQNERDTSKRKVGYFYLTADEHLKVEYQQPNSQKWVSIISAHEQVSYICQLCQRTCTNLTGIIAHFYTQSHLDLMKSTVKEWRLSVSSNLKGNGLEDVDDERTNSNGQGQGEKDENAFNNAPKQSIASEIVQKEHFNQSGDDQSIGTENTEIKANITINSVRNEECYKMEKSLCTTKADEEKLEILKIWEKEYSNLPLDEFIKVQYREHISAQWKPLITTSKHNQYICQLCNKRFTEASLTHLKTKRHLKRLDNVHYKVKHPQYSVYFDRPVENTNESESQKTAMKYNQMNFNELFKLQYFDPILNQWLNMFNIRYRQIITCTLCKNDIKSLNLLAGHFSKKQHLKAVKQVVCEFRLPKLDASSGARTINVNNDEETCSSISENERKVQDQIESMAVKCIKCDLEIDTCILTHLRQSEECMKYMVDHFPSFATNMKQYDNYNEKAEAMLKEIYSYVRRRIGTSTPKQTLPISDSSSECAISQDVVTVSNANSDATSFADDHDGVEILNTFTSNEKENTCSDKDICLFQPNKNVTPLIPSANSELDRFYEEEIDNSSNMIVASSSFSITYDANSLTKNISKQVSSGSSVSRNFDKLLMILKQLTALESVLGVLGPKATNLLTKALALQPLCINSTECVLITSENVLFLETVREKLLGLIEIRVLDAKREIATKRVLYDIIEFLKAGEDNVILI